MTSFYTTILSLIKYNKLWQYYSTDPIEQTIPVTSIDHHISFIYQSLSYHQYWWHTEWYNTSLGIYYAKSNTGSDYWKFHSLKCPSKFIYTKINTLTLVSSRQYCKNTQYKQTPTCIPRILKIEMLTSSTEKQQTTAFHCCVKRKDCFTLRSDFWGAETIPQHQLNKLIMTVNKNNCLIPSKACDRRPTINARLHRVNCDEKPAKTS